LATLHSVLILGPDAVAAANPATAVQLVHACHRWGFSTVVPASWGDELLASEVIRRCAARENRPAIQCSCPRVAERLGTHASKLDDAIIWLATPAVAAAKYIRAHSAGGDIHITYAGSCPGATDASIDQRMSPTELLIAISSRGIDVAAQPTVFEDIVPPDRRRHFSAAAGIPDLQRLWEASAFRVSQPADIDLSIGVAQLLLSDDRVLIDMAPLVGCVCRVDSGDPTAVLRSPSPIVRDGVVDVGRSAPAVPERSADPRLEPLDRPPAATEPEQAIAFVTPQAPKRNSPPRTVLRRQSAWRRSTPRPAVAVTRPSSVVAALPDSVAFLKRPEVRFAIATAVAVGTLMLGMWIGGKRSPTPEATGSASVGQGIGTGRRSP
jgi:hypothetical protein